MQSHSNVATAKEYRYADIAGYDTTFAPAALLAKVKYSRMLVPDRIRKSVAYLGYKDDSGDFVPCGTGFFASCATDGLRFMNFVTAQHVLTDLEKYDGAYIRFNQEGGKKSMGVADLPLDQWYFHPDSDDRFVDVAVCPVNMPKTADYEHLLLEHEGASADVLENESIGPGEEVAIAGFFSHFYGRQKNIPIIRIGNIAAMPDEQINSKSGLMINAYLIEARSIGGLSGSPVLVNMAPWRIVNNKIDLTVKKPQVYLLGLMSGHYDIRAEADTNVTEDALKSAERMNVGVGIVIPFYEIWETVMQPDLENQRQAVVENMRKQGEGVTEDSAIPDDEKEVEQRRDEMLETMLNTPPDPKKGKK